MRRIKNSVKVTIISICAVVVCASAILGVILFGKKTPKRPEEPYSPPREAIEVLENYLTTLQPSVSVSTEVDLESFVDENGGDLAMDDAEFKDDGHIKVYGDEGVYVYLPAKNANNEACYVNPFDYISLPSNTVKKDVYQVRGDYISVRYATFSETYSINLAVYNVENPLSPVLVNSPVVMTGFGSDYDDISGRIELADA